MMNQPAAVPFTIRPLLESDWDAVRSIYLEGIATRNATFELSAPSWSEWDVAHLPGCRLVAGGPAGVAGWAALSPVSQRRVYSGVAEASIYVATAARGRRVGTGLLSALIRDSEAAGIWTLQAGIFPENTASLTLVQRAGFRIVGKRERIGCIEGRWRDVLLLERRSTIAGC